MHVAPETREPLFNFLRENEIIVQVNYIPAYAHPVFSANGLHRGEFINSEIFYKSEISLPMFAGLKDDELEQVLGTISKYFD
jgi:dTDP-4-amino-4,6-dideoxygalactose transaminase